MEKNSKSFTFDLNELDTGFFHLQAEEYIKQLTFLYILS